MVAPRTCGLSEHRPGAGALPPLPPTLAFQLRAGSRLPSPSGGCLPLPHPPLPP